MNETAKKYAFVLGREQEICLEELKSVFDRFGVCFDIFRISGNIVFAKVESFSMQDATSIIRILGGTIKIYEITGSLGNNISMQVSELISKIRSDAESKINFGISCFNKRFTRQQINSFALGAKKKLKGRLSLRFVEAKDELELSSIQTLKNNLADKGIEFGIFDEEIGVLIALNNPEEWNKRDYDKPAFDKYSGMVPPKLARMMVNIALGDSAKISNSEFLIFNQIPNDKSKNDKINENCEMGNEKYNDCVVIDPFCGSGNILMEAMMLGCDVLGSDNSLRAVNDTRTNLAWLTQEISNKNQNLDDNIFQADATSESFIENCKLKIVNYDVVVVAEPYLGEPKKFKTSFNATVGEYEKIYKLYLAFLKNIKQLAMSDKQLSLCLVFPLVETTDQGQFSLYKECVDEIKKLGYTQVRPTMTYGRDYQVVKREIVLLQLK